MKISVLADCHLGAGYNTPLENDPFDNLGEALDNSGDCDLIIIAGDLFDSRSPRTTVWARSISLLKKPLRRKSGAALVSSTKKMDSVHEKSLGSTPVICLHGNHDRRMRDETNAVQALDEAGMLIHLHKQNAVFEKEGVRVAVHGMSSVPERYAKGALADWNPKPLPNCYNILVIHQNVEPYAYSPLEPQSLKLSDLPKGFDLILNGHIHTRAIEKLGDTVFMILGSTVTTQFDKKEAGAVKGFHKISLENGKRPEIEFVPLENSRRFFYYEVGAENPEAMRNEVDKILGDVVSSNLKKKPVVRFKIFGKDTSPVDHDISMLHRKYSDKTILSFSKQIESAEIAEKLEFMQNLRDQRLSVEEIGLNILKKNLEEMKFSASLNHEYIFKLLSDNAVDKAASILVGDQRALYDSIGGRK